MTDPGIPPIPEIESPTFAEFLQEFRQSFGGWSSTTWRGASGIVRALEAEFGQLHSDRSPLAESTAT